LNRINTIIESVQKAVAGDFSSRIETSNKNDELDKLSNAINQLVELMSEQIADKKQTDTALKDSEEKYRRLQANIPGMVYLFAMHPNGSYSFPYVNDASKELFDISPEDLMRDATLITKLIHPDDRERFDTSVKRSAENLEPWREVLRHIVNGEVRWYDCISRPELQENGDILWDGIILEITDRRRIEEALRENEATLRSIYETSPMLMGVVELTEDDKIFHIYDNPATARFFNVEYEGTHNKAADELGAPSEAISEWLLGYRQSQQLGKPVRFEYIHPTPDGQLWLSATVSIIGTGYNGRPRFSYVAEDITERQRAEEVIHQSEKQFKTLFMSMSDGFYLSETLFDDNGNPCDYRYVEVNPKFEQIMGLSRDQIIGKRYKELVPVDTTRWLDVYCTVARTGTPLTYEFYSNEYQMYFETYSYQPTKGQVSVFVRNITERKRAETALQQAKDYAEKLVESANAMIMVLDAEGKVQVFNKAAEEITGYTRQELLGRDWFEVLVPKDKYQNVWDAFQKSAKEGLPASFENPILTKAGLERFILWRNTEVLQDGVFVGSISYGIDITRRKQLEKQLLQSQKMEAIGQLAGGVAHDFNNMLSVILGHSELIKSGLPADHPLLENILEIEKAGFHSKDITRQLLAFSRKQIIAPKTINLNQLITNTRKTLLQLIGENIDLRFIPEQDLWKVRFDPSQVDQILINLAVNARDVMPYEGKLTIETSNIYLDEIYCGSHSECRPGHYVLLMVSDDGAGMDKETLSHVFEPFFTTKDVGKGTGLGLATVYGIVKQNGGFVNVYSEPEKGTTFKIYIPRIMDEVEEKRIKKTPMKSHSGTILLVEDDDMVRKMTASILERIGYSVVTAEAPLEALELIEKGDTPIELLITDVVMPQMNGTDLYEKIKMIKPGINVLFMSGYTENVIVRNGVLKEDVHFVQKPFSMNVFAQKVRDAMENR
jgi:PAS domain S-box-containing protein